MTNARWEKKRKEEKEKGVPQRLHRKNCQDARKERKRKKYKHSTLLQCTQICATNDSTPHLLMRTNHQKRRKDRNSLQLKLLSLYFAFP